MYDTFFPLLIQWTWPRERENGSHPHTKTFIRQHQHSLTFTPPNIKVNKEVRCSKKQGQTMSAIHKYHTLQHKKTYSLEINDDTHLEIVDLQSGKLTSVRMVRLEYHSSITTKESWIGKKTTLDLKNEYHKTNSLAVPFLIIQKR